MQDGIHNLEIDVDDGYNEYDDMVANMLDYRVSP